jgi:hypothetical protein
LVAAIGQIDLFLFGDRSRTAVRAERAIPGTIVLAMPLGQNLPCFLIERTYCALIFWPTHPAMKWFYSRHAWVGIDSNLTVPSLGRFPKIIPLVQDLARPVFEASQLWNDIAAHHPGQANGA